MSNTYIQKDLGKWDPFQKKYACWVAIENPGLNGMLTHTAVILSDWDKVPWMSNWPRFTFKNHWPLGKKLGPQRGFFAHILTLLQRDRFEIVDNF